MLRLPSRYEDLDAAFRGRLLPNRALLDIIQTAFSSMKMSGGIRFLPIFGNSGVGKSSAALEISTHLPELYTEKLPLNVIEDTTLLLPALDVLLKQAKDRRLVVVIDQYEEVAAQRTSIPSTFIEALSLLDRNKERPQNILFIWLTTSKEFQASLQNSTSRNRRILIESNFEITGLNNTQWPEIIQETFRFHNQGKDLSDYEVLDLDLVDIADKADTIGTAIDMTGRRLASYNSRLHDLSNYLVVMLWPVTDGHRITRVAQFTDQRQGYKLDWNAWYRQLNQEEQNKLPLREYNKARLYFDVRLIPIAAADLHPLCRDIDDDNYNPGQSYLDRLKSTHFFSIVSGTWNPANYSPMRERESLRADSARVWYHTVNQSPAKLGKRIAKCLTALDLPSAHERDIASPHSKVRADILIDRTPITPSQVVVEMKAYSAENTMPSTIASAILTTLRRHAQLAGFISKQ